MNARRTTSAFVFSWLVPVGAGAAARWEIRPTLVLSARHDDNPFLRAERALSAANVGAEPFLVVARRTARATLSLSAGQAAERYAGRPEIDTLDARQSLSAHADVFVTRRWTGRLDVSQLRTDSAGELTTSSGLDLGRRAARRRQLTAASTYAGSRTTALTGELAVTGDTAAGVPSLTSTVGGLRMDRRLPHDGRLSARYEFRRHTFAGRASTSHRLGLGLERPIARSLEVTAFAGPRFARDHTGLEWQLGARFRTRRAELTAEWSDAEGAVVGAAGPAFVRRATASGATVSGRFHLRALLDRASTRGGVAATLLRGSLEAGYRVARPLSVVCLATRGRQRDNLHGAPRDVRHTVVEMRIVVTPGLGRREEPVGR